MKFALLIQVFEGENNGGHQCAAYLLQHKLSNPGY